MFIPRTSYSRAYDAIVAASRSTPSTTASACSVLLVVSMDVDALLASRMLSVLLERDCIAYRVHPVSGWKELTRVNTEVIAQGDFRNVVLLNLGAPVDLADYLGLPEGVQAHVIDSHRPYSLENLFADGDGEDGERDPEQIVVWDDGDVDEEMREERLAYEAVQYEPESDSDSDSDDSEEEDEFEYDEEDLDSDGEPRKKRKLGDGGVPRLSKREKRKHRARIRKYYGGGTHFGQSVAGQMYVLATLRGCQDNDLLWYAILGLTYQFTSSLIDRDRYDAYVQTYQREVDRINILPPTTNLSAEVNLQGADDRMIRPSEELRFMLFRHWNLYDAMFHSGYVAGKLKLWRERGRRNLQGLLAKMGFSLLQCQQTYSHMDMDLKRTLRSKVDALAPSYGLFDLSFPSFLRAYGYQSVLSASDCVEALAALLEVANGVRLDFAAAVGGQYAANGVGSGAHLDAGQGGTYWDGGKGVKGWTEMGGNGAGQGDKENRDVEGGAKETAPAGKKTAKEEEWWVKNFWLAWDALSPDTTLLRSALPLSMALHRSIIRQGTSMLDKQSIKTLRSFRLAVIKEGPDLGTFTHPATLTRLGLWLVDAIRDLVAGQTASTKGKKPKSLPFVLASLDETKDTFLVVGVNGAVEYGDVRKNKFGLAFQEAAAVSGARARHDRFEESVCEVRKDDLMAFVEKLHLGL